MKQNIILVEGRGDQKFIVDFLAEHYGFEAKKKEDIIDLVGKDKLVNFKTRLLENTDKGGRNIAILDADLPDKHDHGGFEARLKYLENLVKKNDIAIDFFLFPNHKDDGDLETILENIINPKNKEIFECWNEYENCLKSKENPHSEDKSFNLPAKKSKIYSYLECLLPDTTAGKELVKDPKRDYTNRQHWELHNLDNEYIKRLKTFLDQYYLAM